MTRQGLPKRRTSVRFWSDSFNPDESIPLHELITAVASCVPPERASTVLLNIFDDSNGRVQLTLTYDKD